MTAVVQPVQLLPRRRFDVLRQVLRNPSAVVGLVLVVVLVAAGLLGPLVTPFSAVAPDFATVLQPPSGTHWFGTDELGRDVLSRTLAGIAVSVRIALLSVFLAGAIGIPLGLLAGYIRPVDAVVSRIVELLMAFPNLVIAIGLAAILGPSMTNVTIAIAVSNLPGFIRVSRAEVMRLRGLEFVESATAIGASQARIMGLHLLPNSLSALLVQVTVMIPGAVLGESILSFLGLGVQPPDPTLGTMLSAAQPFVETGWWMAAFPGLAILGLTLGFNMFGDALRDATDPKMLRRG